MRNAVVKSCLVILVAMASACASAGGGDGTSSCSPQTGQCPNVCTKGTAVQGEKCTGPNDCQCGLFCKSDTCQPYEGANAGCACKAVGGSGAGGGTVDAGGTGGTTSDTGGTGGGTADSGGTTGPDTCPTPKPKGSDCNPYCQTGCTAGKQCSYSNGDFGCFAVGKKAMGEKCASTKDCAQGLACFQLTGDPNGQTCKLFCQADKDCGADRKCDLDVDFGDGAKAKFCGDVAVGCDPFEIPSTKCGAGQGCYLINNATKCGTAGTLKEGEKCAKEQPTSCAAGLQCLVVCSKICNVIEVNPGNPKCIDGCKEGKFQSIDDETGIGLCIGDTFPSNCDLFKQTGCGPGEGCFPVQGGADCLEPNNGGAKEGEKCQYTNDCAPGTICVSNLCSKLCDATPTAPDATNCTKVCKSFNTITPEAWKIGICVDEKPKVPCDFWKQDCTEPGEVCAPVQGGATCLGPSKGGTEGQACKYVTDCAKGIVCDPTTSKCTKPCSIAEVVPAGVPVCLDTCPEGKFHPIADLGASLGACGAQ